MAFPDIALAWHHKETLRTWYATATPSNAQATFHTWLAQVERTGPPEVITALTALRTWEREIVAFFTFRISNGYVEGTNNRTKALMRQGYGYRNRHHLRWRILTNTA